MPGTLGHLNIAHGEELEFPLTPVPSADALQSSWPGAGTLALPDSLSLENSTSRDRCGQGVRILKPLGGSGMTCLITWHALGFLLFMT